MLRCRHFPKVFLSRPFCSAGLEHVHVESFLRINTQSQPCTATPRPCATTPNTTRLGRNFSKKTAIVSFVLERFLVMAPKASKAADQAEQLETPSSSQGPVSVTAGSSSSVRNKVRPATKRRIEISEGVADIGEASPRDERQHTFVSESWEGCLVFSTQRHRHAIDANIAARLLPRLFGLKTICGTRCSCARRRVGFSKTVFKPTAPKCRSKFDEVCDVTEGCSWFFVRGGPEATSFRAHPRESSVGVAKPDTHVIVRRQRATLGTPRQRRWFVSAQNLDPLVLHWCHLRSPAVERSDQEPFRELYF